MRVKNSDPKTLIQVYYHLMGVNDVSQNGMRIKLIKTYLSYDRFVNGDSDGVVGTLGFAGIFLIFVLQSFNLK